MALWEYKVITSGLHGFASPSLLESHLNTLGKDEWEIIHFQTLPNNPLAFNGLARRSTTRDWTPPPETPVSRHASLESSAPALKPAPKPEIEPAAEPARAEDKKDTPPLREETFRPVRNTEHDLDPDAEEAEEDDWDNWDNADDELPTFFEAIKPHLRRNQKGPGMSVGLDYLAKRWEQREADIVGALKECGITVPENEDADPEFFEFEGDLYWVNRNNRGQLFLNTREKPRPVFRIAQVQKLASDDPALAELTAERAAEKAEIERRKSERNERQAAQAAASAPAVTEPTPEAIPESSPEPTKAAAASLDGPALLDRIRPLMRRNRRGPGYSGSAGFLARALKMSESELIAAFAAMKLLVPANANDKPVYVEIGDGVYWINKDNRGGIWINGREKKENGQKQAQADGPEAALTSETAEGPAPAGESSPTEIPSAPASETGAANQPPVETSSAAPAVEPAAATPALEQPAAATTAATPAAESVETPSSDAQPSDEPASDDETGTSSEGETNAPMAAIATENEMLAALRPLLKPGKRAGSFAAELPALAEQLGKPEADLVAALTSAGLTLPANPDEKAVAVSAGADSFWLSRADEQSPLVLNVKATRARRPSRSRSVKKPKADEAKPEGSA